MLVGDLSRIIRVIVADYTKFDVSGLLNEALNVLSLKGTNNAGLYSSKATSLRNRARQIIDGEHELLRSSRVRSIVEKSDFKQTLPSDFARKAAELVPDSVQASGLTTDARFLIDQYNQAQTSFLTFLQTASALKADEFDLPSDRAVLRFVLPERATELDFDVIANILQDINRFFVALSTFSSGVVSTPKLLYASTTDLSFLSHVDYATAHHALTILKDCFDTAKSALMLGQYLLGMQRITGNTSGQDAYTKNEEARVRATMEAAVNKIPNSGTDPEHRTKLVITSSRIVKLLEQGVSIELYEETTQTLSVIGGDSEEEQQIIKGILADQRASRVEISELLDKSERVRLPAHQASTGGSATNEN